jgi:hypothetical protein
MIIMGTCEVADNIRVIENSVGILYDYKSLICMQLLGT